MKPSRRQFCSTSAATLAALAGGQLSAPLVFAEESTDSDNGVGPLETHVPTRGITSGPKHHWFGYYDKRQFDPTGRYVLANQVDFEGRSPTGDDKIDVGIIDTDQGDHWTPIGTSGAWGWQQGCMLQWIGDDGRRILWNDRDGKRLVCRIYDRTTKQTRTLAKPIYTISQDGTFGLSVDFRRINNLRPGYGYSGLSDPFVDQHAPEESGIWRIDLETGEESFVVSLADVAKIAWPNGSTHDDAWHYFNHLLINPSGTRFIVLHRFRPKFDPETLKFEGGFQTRMFTMNIDGSERYVLDPSGNTSHFIWKDDEQVTMWTRPRNQPVGFYRYQDQSTNVTRVGADKMPSNGHNTYLGGDFGEWILNDTYPDRKTRRQTVYLYHPPSDRRFDLGHFPSPRSYTGEWRCDTHPRSSPDGTLVTVDSPHQGGRQVYRLEIGDLLQKNA